jgi:SAM-dependent methyltransferase
MHEFQFACPICRTLLVSLTANILHCPVDGSIFDCRDGIWRFLPPDRQVYYEQFMREYQTVRQAEGRGSTDAGYYRSLPFVDLTGQFSADWQIRARSFRTFLSDVLQPMERTLQRPLRVIDLGAGNGWLSYRLAQRSHYVAAVDLIDNPFDGLGAHVYYDAAFTPVQAEFDRLPLTDSYIDLAILNASLHYATRYETTLGEALRVLQPAGQIVILDSPLYRSAGSGAEMVREREAAFTQKVGFPSDALPSENYLTDQRLSDLSVTLRLRWQFIQPVYGWRWALRPLKARLLRRREPARFVIIVGRRWT